MERNALRMTIKLVLGRKFQKDQCMSIQLRVLGLISRDTISTEALLVMNMNKRAQLVTLKK